MKSLLRNPIILVVALAIAAYSTALRWAVGWSWETGGVLYYDGRDILHKDIAWMPLVFYIIAIIAVMVVWVTAKEKSYLTTTYKGLFFLNFLPIGAYLFVMIMDYHTSNYFTEVGLGYYLWLLSNAVIMGWLYLILYTKIALPEEETHPDLIDDLPSFLNDDQKR